MKAGGYSSVFGSLSPACCGSGVESCAPAGPVPPPAHCQERYIDAEPTKKQEVEPGAGFFGVAWARRQNALVPGRQVPVTMDVYVRRVLSCPSLLCDISVQLNHLESSVAPRWFSWYSPATQWRKSLTVRFSCLCQSFFWGVSVPQVDLQRSVSDRQLSKPAGWGGGCIPGG